MLVLLLGLYCLLSVQGLVETGAKLEGWINLAIGIFLLGQGVLSLGTGLLQVMRFFVGRGVPTSLAKNRAKAKSMSMKRGIAYSDVKMEQMLQGRKNLTFTEPQGWLSHLVHTLIPKLLFLPYMYRNMVTDLVKGLSQTLLAFFCYGLAWFQVLPV